MERELWVVKASPFSDWGGPIRHYNVGVFIDRETAFRYAQERREAEDAYMPTSFTVVRERLETDF